MSSLARAKLKKEEQFLRLASALVTQGELESAVNELKNALSYFPESQRIINALGRVLLKSSRPEEAAFYFKKSLNLHVEEIAEDDLPSDDDLDYLDEQEVTLNESEYFFEKDDEENNDEPKRKTLSLKSKREEKGLPNKKIIIKKRVLPKPDDEIDRANEEKELTDLDGSGQLVDEPEPELCSENLPSDELDKELLDDYEAISQENVIGFDTEDGDQYLENCFPDSIPDLENDKSSEDEGSDKKNNFLDDEDWFDLYSFIEEQGDFEEEEQEKDVLEEEKLGVLASEISKPQRARQVAVALVEAVGWNKVDIALVTDIFLENGWKAARVALEREINLGATRNELELAFEIKKIWKECDRYWISFSRVRALGETTDATHRHCSWKQALRLVRLFEGIPSIDEIVYFLENEFEYWFDSRILRSRFKAFSKYLFSYRLNDYLLHIDISEFRRFDQYVAFDELNSSCFMSTHSDEVAFLRSHGIDLFEQYAPKSYYISDKPFDPAFDDKPKKIRFSDNNEGDETQ